VTRRGVLLFAAMCLIWGIPYLLIKVAVRDFSPPALVMLRTGIGAVVLLPFAFARGAVRPVLRRWLPLLVYTAVELALAWVLLSDAERRVTSSLSGLSIAAVPLVAAVVVRLMKRDERLEPHRIVGLLVGAGGVAVLLGFDLGSSSALSLVELGVVVLCYAAGPIIADKWLSDVPSMGVVALSLAICAVGYAPVAIPQLPSHLPSTTVLLATALLGVVCTALAFLVFFALIAEVGPARAPVFTFVNPAVAVVLGVLLLHEPLSWSTIAGFVLILTGSVLSTRRRRPAPVAPEPETAAEAPVPTS
jgi:drug/metabolite transporter (DMT)-like permease